LIKAELYKNHIGAADLSEVAEQILEREKVT
jgi:hypothetical protein